LFNADIPFEESLFKMLFGTQFLSPIPTDTNSKLTVVLNTNIAERQTVLLCEM